MIGNLDRCMLGKRMEESLFEMIIHSMTENLKSLLQFRQPSDDDAINNQNLLIMSLFDDDNEDKTSKIVNLLFV